MLLEDIPPEHGFCFFARVVEPGGKEWDMPTGWRMRTSEGFLRGANPKRQSVDFSRLHEASKKPLGQNPATEQIQQLKHFDSLRAGAVPESSIPAILLKPDDNIGRHSIPSLSQPLVSFWSFQLFCKTRACTSHPVPSHCNASQTASTLLLGGFRVGAGLRSLELSLGGGGAPRVSPAARLENFQRGFGRFWVGFGW